MIEPFGFENTINRYREPPQGGVAIQASGLLVPPRNDGHACAFYLPLGPQGTVCPLKYPALTGFPARFHALKHRFAFVTHAISGLMANFRARACFRSGNLLICLFFSVFLANCGGAHVQVYKYPHLDDYPHTVAILPFTFYKEIS